MKKIILFLFLTVIFFSAGFAAARWLKEHPNPFADKALVEEAILDNRFQPNSFPLKNRAFAIVIAGYNNGAYAQKTLNSIFSQNYENYRLIYIDDASDDGSYDLARDLIYDSGQILRATVVRNEQRLGTLANICRAVQSCPDDEIVVVVNGEDWLAHEWVLQRLNAYYSDPDLWMTYGQYLDFPNFEAGIARAFKLKDWNEKGVRAHPFIASHLKTFYAGLFKKIKEADFIFQGKFLPLGSDLAYMIPMLEMAKDHFHFIPEVLYISNRQTIQKDDRDLQVRCEKYIRSLNPYPPLTALSFRSSEENEGER